MAERIPLGEKEAYHLEFKSAEALRKPETIGREIVGMLNAGGGEVWIGLEEDNGIATRIENIPDPDRAARVLLDHLVETIEPSLRHDDVKIEKVGDASGATVLLVHVGDRRQSGPPSAYRTRNGRYFGVRVADRLRAMSWHEIFAGRMGRTSEYGDRWSATTKNVTKELDKALGNAAPRYWLYLKPVVSLNLRFDDDTERLFWHPDETKNRANGWNFVDRNLHVERSPQIVVHGKDDGRRTAVRRDGSILFTAPLEFLHWKGEPRLIWPYILIEFTVSIFRLASRLYGGKPDPEDDRIAAQLALVSARDWKLKAGSVKSVRWSFGDASTLTSDDAMSGLTEVRMGRLLDAPDGCAYPLIQDVYEEFGLGPDDLPSEFAPDAALTFPT